MKILGTVSRRSKGKIFIELFQFGGLLMVWALSISYEPRSLFATREGERCMKGSVHPVRHPRVHLGERASAQARESFARQNGQNGRGMPPCWAGATHDSLSRTVPNLGEAGEEGRNYVLQLCLHHLLLLVNLISLGKTRK